MGIAQDLQDMVDELRADLADEMGGLRFHTVKTRLVAWSTEIGDPDAVVTNTDVPLDPQPRIRQYGIDRFLPNIGLAEEGDLIADRISKDMTIAQIEGPALNETTQEWYWLVDTEPYRVINTDGAMSAIGWTVLLRKTIPTSTG